MTTQTTDYTALLRLEIERNQITAQRIFMQAGNTRRGMRLAALFREAALLLQRELGRVEKYDPSQR